MARNSKEGGLDLGAAAGGVGEDEAGTKAEGGAGCFQGVATGGDVVHEIGLAQGQEFASAGNVVLLGRDRTKRQLVAGALGLHRVRAVDGFENLCT